MLAGEATSVVIMLLQKVLLNVGLLVFSGKFLLCVMLRYDLPCDMWPLISYLQVRFILGVTTMKVNLEMEQLMPFKNQDLLHLYKVCSHGQ